MSRRAGRRPEWARLLPALATVMALAALAGSAQAAGPTVSLTPVGAAGAKGYFVYTAHGGSRISGQVSLVNTSGARGAVLLYAVDATTGQTTGAVYQSRARRRHDVGAWTKLPIRRVVLGSHGRAQVSFRLRVPRGARGGQHLGAIVAQPVSPVRRYSTRKGSHAFHINVQALSVLAVQVNVPTRPVQRLTVNGCRAGGPHGFQTLFVGMANTGNQFVKGTGTVTVARGAATAIKHQSFALDTFLPGTSISYPVVLTGKPLRAGNYRAVVSLTYGKRHHVTRVLACKISNHSIVQVFGAANAAQITPPGGGSGPSALVIVIGGIALLALGFGAAVLLNRRAQQH
ncbi:MAG TPA: hypothetical protein VIY10_22520 [Solirubrobacteraceae bacterium]|jgi:hypothetical protein